MFRRTYDDKVKTTPSENKEPEKKEVKEEMPKEVPVRPPATAVRSSNVNKILKGSKLIGDINVTCDLELNGDVEGN
ncbi:MAG: hypothetical protein AMJ60_10045, partial [Desulfobacterales bacterium SG8_35]